MDQDLAGTGQDPAGSSPEAGRSLAVVDIRRMAVDRDREKGRAADRGRLGLGMGSHSVHMEMHRHRSIRWEGLSVACGRAEVWLDRRLGAFGCRKLGERLKAGRTWLPLWRAAVYIKTGLLLCVLLCVLLWW